MKPWDTEDIRRAAKARWLYRASGAAKFNGRIAIDSRKAKAGELFFAIKGERFDAHDFVGDVIERKVAAVIVHRELPQELLLRAQAMDVGVLLVEDTIAGLNRLAAAYRATGMRAKVIAVGGSNGKTTTKFIIQTLLSEKFAGHASPKSFNNNIGMPLTLLEVEPAHDFVVLEIGTNKPGEIDALGKVCRPDIALITSVGLEHLEFFGDLAGVAREEASIAPLIAAGGTLIYPAASPALTPFLKNATCQKIVVARKIDGEAPQADLTLGDVRESLAGTRFSINGRGDFALPLLGEHNAMNALMAIAVARRMGLSDEQIASGLAKVKAADMRFEPLGPDRFGPYAIINDAYNANPSSMEASLKTFDRLTTSGPGARRVVILGDMLELGATADAMHRSIGGLVSACQFDLLIAIGKHMRLTADVAAESGIPVHHFPSTQAAKAALKNLLNPGDQILLKGSRSMALETLLETLKGSPALTPN